MTTREVSGVVLQSRNQAKLSHKHIEIAHIYPNRPTIEAELQKAIVRNERVAGLYEKLYEDNAVGKVTDEWFMQLSHKYEVVRMGLKTKIAEYKERLRGLDENNRNKENFISAVRKFKERK